MLVECHKIAISTKYTRVAMYNRFATRKLSRGSPLSFGMSIADCSAALRPVQAQSRILLAVFERGAISPRYVTFPMTLGYLDASSW